MDEERMKRLAEVAAWAEREGLWWGDEIRWLMGIAHAAEAFHEGYVNEADDVLDDLSRDLDRAIYPEEYADVNGDSA